MQSVEENILSTSACGNEQIFILGMVIDDKISLWRIRIPTQSPLDKWSILESGWEQTPIHLAMPILHHSAKLCLLLQCQFRRRVRRRRKALPCFIYPYPCLAILIKDIAPRRWRRHKPSGTQVNHHREALVHLCCFVRAVTNSVTVALSPVTKEIPASTHPLAKNPILPSASAHPALSFAYPPLFMQVWFPYRVCEDGRSIRTHISCSTNDRRL